MKNKFLTLFVSILAVIWHSNVYGQETASWPKKSINVMLGYGSLEQESWLDIRSNVGFAINGCRTFYITGGMRNFMRLGIDFVFSDLSYTQYKIKFLQEPKVWNKTLHNFDLSMQAGLCLAMMPASNFTVTPYVRYAPAFHYYRSEDLNETSFSIFGINAGIRTVYKFMGLGIEYYWLNSKLPPLFAEHYNYENNDLSTNKWNMRVYVSFNF